MQPSKLFRFTLLILIVLGTSLGSSLEPMLHPGINEISIANAQDISDPETTIRIVDSSDAQLTIEFKAPAYEIQQFSGNGLDCQIIKADGFSKTDRAGWPELPAGGFNIGIPPQSIPTLEIVEFKASIHTSDLRICPVSQPLGDSDTDGRSQYFGSKRITDPIAYQINGLYPEKPVELLSTAKIRSQQIAQFRISPFRYNPSTGHLQVVERILFNVNFNNMENTAATGFLFEESFEPVLQSTLLNYDQARTWRVLPGINQGSERKEIIDSTDQYKILVHQEGMYKLTFEALDAAGVPVDTLDPLTLRIHNQGEEIAIIVVGEDDGVFNPGEYILFYGEQVNTIYTYTNVYWLTWGGDPGIRMQDIDGSIDNINVPTQFSATELVEENHYYQSARASGPENDRWYWDYIYASSPITSTFTTNLENISGIENDIQIRGYFHGHSATPEYHTKVYLNGHLVDDANWAAGAEYSFTEPIQQSYLVEGLNEIEVVAVFDGGISLQFFWINRFEIDYFDTYTAENNILFFNGELDGQATREWNYQVGNFTNSDIHVFDITDPITTTNIQNFDVNDLGGTYQLSFEQNIDQDHRYIALTSSQFIQPAPGDIFLDTPSSLRSTSNGADYILITHEDFVGASQDLLDHRSAQGYRTALVDIQDVYDEFNGGVYDAEAIHDFLAYTYDNWVSPRPQFVLLMGDGHYDFFDYQAFGQPNYIPPYLADVDPKKGETAADNRFVAVSGGDILPDMHLGRLPAHTPGDAQIMVDKIINYELNPPTDEWYKEVTFVADDQDDAGDFDFLSDDIADNYLPDSYTKEKIYFKINAPTEDDMRNGITDAINDGRLIINYIGHAAVQSWGHELFYTLDDISSLTNTEKFPIMLPMTCLEGTYHHPDTDYQGMSETLLRDNNGAVASWAPTGYGVASGHDTLEKGLFIDLFNNNNTLLGPATTYAKFYLDSLHAYLDLIDTYLLLGDPALNIKTIQQPIQEINSGWNLISLPVATISGYTAQSLLDDINNQGGSCTDVDRWLNDSWDEYSDGAGTNNFNIEIGAGYFVKCSNPSSWTIDGFELNMGQTVSLNDGWTLVGVPYPKNQYTAGSLVDDIADQGISCSEVNRWKFSGWDEHNIGLVYNDFSITPNSGYFINCSQTGDFTPSH